MDYLRKHHGNDHEKMQMVALKFGMFRELAKTREDQAKKDLRRIHSRHLGEAGRCSLRKEMEKDSPLPCSYLPSFLSSLFGRVGGGGKTRFCVCNSLLY